MPSKEIIEHKMINTFMAKISSLFFHKETRNTEILARNKYPTIDLKPLPDVSCVDNMNNRPIIDKMRICQEYFLIYATFAITVSKDI